MYKFMNFYKLMKTEKIQKYDKKVDLMVAMAASKMTHTIDMSKFYQRMNQQMILKVSALIKRLCEDVFP